MNDQKYEPVPKEEIFSAIVRMTTIPAKLIVESTPCFSNAERLAAEVQFRRRYCGDESQSL